MANEVKEPLKLYFHENTAEQASMLNNMVTNVLNDMGITSIQEEVVENAVSDYLTKHPVHDGEKGDKGDTGATPNISASATVSQTVGIPTVSVEKSGTDEAPNFNFAFSGLKGEKGDKGDDGLDGFASRLDDVEYTDNDYIAIDDGTKARKINVDKFVDDARGKKNYAKVEDASLTSGEMNINITNNIFTLNGQATYDIYLRLIKTGEKITGQGPLHLSRGKYIFKSLGSSASNQRFCIWVHRWKATETYQDRTLFLTITNTDVAFELSQDDADNYVYECMFYVKKGCVADNITFDPVMYKLSDADGVSSNVDLSARVVALENKKYLDIPSISTKDVNIAHVKNGLYADTFNWDSPNLPFTTNSDVITFQGTPNNYSQILISKTADKGQLYIRTMNGGTWGSWKRLVTADELTALAARVTALENK